MIRRRADRYDFRLRVTPAEQLRERWADPGWREFMIERCAEGGRRAQARARTRRALTERSMPHAARTSGGERLLRALVRTGIETSALPAAAALVSALDEAALERAEQEDVVYRSVTSSSMS